MKNWKKFGVATIGTLSILGTTVFAEAGTVNAPSGLVLRGEASKGGAPLATVPDKQSVDIIEENGEWYKVTYNGQEGYLFKEYVKAEEPITTGAETTSTTDGDIQSANNLKVYAIPVITSTVINEIDKNIEISIIKQITNWSYVSAGDVQGWVRTYAINGEVKQVEQNVEEPAKKPETTPTPEPEVVTPKPEEQTEQTSTKPESNINSQETAPTISKGFVNVDYANVRKQASTDSEIVTTLTKDTSFTINAETEEWYKIKYTGIDGTVYEGYIFKNLVSAPNN